MRRPLRLPDRNVPISSLEADFLVSRLSGVPAHELSDWLLVTKRSEPDRDCLSIHNGHNGDARQCLALLRKAWRVLRRARA